MNEYIAGFDPWKGTVQGLRAVEGYFDDAEKARLAEEALALAAEERAYNRQRQAYADETKKGLAAVVAPDRVVTETTPGTEGTLGATFTPIGAIKDMNRANRGLMSAVPVTGSTRERDRAIDAAMPSDSIRIPTETVAPVPGTPDQTVTRTVPPTERDNRMAKIGYLLSRGDEESASKIGNLVKIEDERATKIAETISSVFAKTGYNVDATKSILKQLAPTLGATPADVDKLDFGNGYVTMNAGGTAVFIANGKAMALKPEVTYSPAENRTIDGRTVRIQVDSRGKETQVATGPSNSFNMMINQLEPKEQDAINKAVLEGRLDIYRLNSRNGKMFARIAMADPTANLNQLSGNALWERNTQRMRQDVNLGAVEGPIEDLRKLGFQLNNGNWTDYNEFKNFLSKKFGEPQVVAYEATRNNVMQELANAMRGAGISEGSIQLEMSNWSTAFSPAQIDAAADRTLAVIRAKREEIRKKPFPDAAPRQGKGAPAPAGGKKPSEMTTEELLKAAMGGK